MVRSSESLSKDLTPEEFTRFRDYIHTHSGIYLEENKTDSLRISLITRATRLEMQSLAEYYTLLGRDEGEFKELLNLVTINETSFFRFPAQFDAFRDSVIPEILESKPVTSRAFRVWSAGCSTGEEPYTIAMSLLDSGLPGLGYKPEVFGTDVSTDALLRAKNAEYPPRAVANLSQEIINRHFIETESGRFRVAPKVRSLIEFGYHNLIQEPYPLALMGNWDVIFCRNVTIYFRLDSTRRVVSNFYDSLNPGGYLFIGHSETLTSVSDQFEPVEVDGVFLYRKPLPKRYTRFADVVGSKPAQPTPTGRKERDSAVRQRLAERTAAPSRFERMRAEKAAGAAATPVGAGTDAEGASELVRKAYEALAAALPAKALDYAQAALEADPRSVEAYLVAAYAHADTGAFDAAIDECNKALEIDPLTAAARYILGVIYQQLDDPMRAMAEFKRTIYIDSGFVVAHFALANLYRARSAFDDACREYANTLRALARNPEGEWTTFMGGFNPDLLSKSCERSLIECQKAAGRG